MLMANRGKELKAPSIRQIGQRGWAKSSVIS
jgi:hypothetical protein